MLLTFHFPPHPVPHLESRSPQHLLRIFPQQSEVPGVPCKEAHGRVTFYRPVYLLVILPEVTARHNLLQQLFTSFRVRLRQQIPFIQSEHPFHHIHHRPGKSVQIQFLRLPAEHRLFLLRTSSFQQHRIIRHLPQSYALAEHMPVHMHQHIHPVHLVRRHTRPAP